MNNLIESPIGEDAIIKKVMIALYGLRTIWSPPNTVENKLVQLDGYPRCYHKLEDGKRTIEWFDKKREYKQNLVVAEKNKFWFTIPTPKKLVAKTMNQYEVKIELYFTVNLEQIKKGFTHRADNEARTDVLNVLKKIHEIRVVDVVTDIEKVYSGLDYDPADDRHPYHCFKIILNAYNFRADFKYCPTPNAFMI